MSKIIFIFIITLSILFSSCASFLYPDGRRQKNNTLKISSNTNATLIFPKAKYRDDQFFNKSFQVNNNVTEIFIPKLKRRLMTISVDNNDEIKNIKLKRNPRFGAIFKSTIISCFTLGLPFIIDPFRPDFYKLSKSSRNLNIQFSSQTKNEYKSDITKNEFNKSDKKQNLQKEHTSYSSNGSKENPKKIETNIKNTDYQNSTKSDSNEKLVTLTTIGQGKTLDEAKLSALRSAIEQAFGTFVSSNTQILNDELLKDDITSIANGNIEKYDIISQNQISEQSWAVTIKSVVSLNKMVNYCKNKGNEVSIDGASFAMNIKITKLNAESEIKAIENLLVVFDKLLSNAFDYEINVDEPKASMFYENYFDVVMRIYAITNENYSKAIEYFETTINSIIMSDEESFNFRKMNYQSYPAPVPFDQKVYRALRSKISADLLDSYFLKNLDLSSHKRLVNMSDKYTLKYEKFKINDGTNFKQTYEIDKYYFNEKSYNRTPNEIYASEIVDSELWGYGGNYVNRYKIKIHKSGVCVCVWKCARSYTLSELEKLKTISVSPVNE